MDAVLTAARGVWGPIDDIASVTDGARDATPSVPVSSGVPVTLVGTSGSALERRMVRAGVDPGAGVTM